MKDQAIEKVGPAAIVRPAFIPAEDVRDAEPIEREDIQMPRLALAQATSPELDETSPKFIEGLRFGDAFNSLTGESYGKKAIEVVIVRRDPPRYVEFHPRTGEGGGGIKDYNVPAGDPRTAFGPNGEKPIATKFAEYVALIGREPIVLSFKGAGLKTAKLLNGLLLLASQRHGNVPFYALRFSLTPATESNTQGKYAIFTTPRFLGVVDAAGYAYAKQVHDEIRGKTIAAEVDATPEADEDTPF